MDGKFREDASPELSARERFRNLFNALSEEELTEDNVPTDAEGDKLMIAVRLVGKYITAEEFLEAFAPTPTQIEELCATQGVRLPRPDKSSH